MNKKVDYLARAIILLAAAGIVIAGAIWDKDIVELGGIPLLVAALSWFAPAPAGIIGIPFSLYQIARWPIYGGILPSTPLPGEAWHPIIIPNIPQGLYYMLYGSFLLGCVISVYTGARQLRHAPKAAPGGIPLRFIARAITGISLLVSVIVFLFVEGSVAFTFNVWAIIAFITAWWWPGAGGALMIFVGGLALFNLLSHNYSTERMLVYSPLFFIFAVGGLMNVYLYLKNARSGQCA
jgi:hypothetical protein